METENGLGRASETIAELRAIARDLPELWGREAEALEDIALFIAALYGEAVLGQAREREVLKHAAEARRLKLQVERLKARVAVLEAAHPARTKPKPRRRTAREGGGAGWWSVLGVPRTSSLAEVEAAWKRQIRRAHPDAGGAEAAAVRVNAARDEARREIDRRGF